MSTAALPSHLATPVAVESEESSNYLNIDHSLKSWLLTQDHKRIALMYLIGVTFFFGVGGLLAFFLRLELLTPGADLMAMDTYNKVFTMHGIVMVFFVLIPAVPAILGNFLIPLMLGARDLAFPRLNLLSWYCFMIAGLLLVSTVIAGASIRAGPSRRRSARASGNPWRAYGLEWQTNSPPPTENFAVIPVVTQGGLRLWLA